MAKQSRRKFKENDDVRIVENSCFGMDSVEAFVMGFSDNLYKKRKAHLMDSGAAQAYKDCQIAYARFLNLAGHISEEDYNYSVEQVNQMPPKPNK